LTSLPHCTAFIAATVSAFGFNGSNGKSLLFSDAHQQQAHRIGHGETDFLERRRSFPLGALVDAGANDALAVMALSPFVATL
jgi:hypothetical protein